ncbi:MAG: kelch-like protein [Planctomycetota bacterium]|nr:MAG: kelch-like protein [Planctomycetota bacterium]
MDMRNHSITLCAIALILLPGRWFARAPLPAPRQEVGVAAARGEVFVAGGITNTTSGVPTVEAYDPRSNSWRSVADLPIAVHHTGLAGVGNRLFCIGGLRPGGFGPTDQVFEYDFGQDLWTPRAPMPTRRGATGIAVWNGIVYVAGGTGVSGSVTAFEAYDPATNTWTVLPDFSVARNHLAAGAVAGRIVVLAGRDSGLVPQTEVFDVATGTWSFGAPIPTPRGGCGGATVGDRIFVIGGEGNPNTPTGVFDDVEAYDLLSDTWSTFTPMRTPRHGIGAVGQLDNRRNLGFVLVPGGATQQGFGPSAANEVFVFRP